MCARNKIHAFNFMDPYCSISVCIETLLFLTEVFEASGSANSRKWNKMNVLNSCKLFLLSYRVAVYECTSEPGTLDQSPNSRTAKPNSDRGKNVEAYVNSPIYRRGQWSQSTTDTGTRWTNSHQHRQHATISSMSILGNANAKEKSCKRIITCVHV